MLKLLVGVRRGAVGRFLQALGTEDWIYIHIEVQGSAQAEVAERMFVYNYRLYDRYRRPIASIAVLADETANWRPTTFAFEALGCEHRLKFPTAKLLDYQGKEEALQADANPFALVTLAHLPPPETTGHAHQRGSTSACSMA